MFIPGFLLYFVSSFGLLSSVYGQTYHLEYVTAMSPPASVPAAASRVYSIAVNAITSRPIKALVKDASNNDVTTGDFFDVLQYQVETLDVNAVGNPSYTDTWLDTGGHLVMWGQQAPVPGRLQRKFFTFITEDSNKIRNFTIDRGMLAVDGLIHNHPAGTVPPNNRVYRLTLTLAGGTTIHVDSNPIQITAEARSLALVGSLPATVEAGTPFSLTFNIMDKDGVHLTTGSDSVLFGEIHVAVENDTMLIYDRINREDILFQEMIRMRGPNAVKKMATNVYVIRSQFVGGTASFNDITILDVHPGVRLNCTMFLQNFPWTRRPDQYSDFASKVVYPWATTGDTVLFMNTSYPQDPAVYLSAPIPVTAQTATQLVITTKADIKAKHNANFPLEAEVVVEIRDTNGRRVYSGPDSTLEIAVTTTPPGTCLSADANFTAVDGQGIFLGSICEAIAAVTLQFDAVSAVSGSPLTPDVTGSVEINNEIHLASFAALGFSGTGQHIGGHLDGFSHFAANDINNGQHSILTGRQLVLHTYNTAYSVAVSVKQYKAMKAMGEADPSQKVRGIVGFGDNTISTALQPFLTDEQLPQIGTREDLHDFGDKGSYPYFNRICWDMGGMSHSIMLAAKSRTWVKGVVLRCRDVAVSGVFYSKAKQMGIDLTEVTLPVLEMAQYGSFGILGADIRKMKSLGTKIVWLFCRAPLLWKVIHELHLAEATPQHGYQWATVGVISWMMPYGNGIGFCQGNPLCSVMSKGSQGFASTYYISGLRTPLWEQVLEYHIKKDMMYYSGSVPKHTLNVVTAEFGLGYDAVLLFAKAMDKLITDQLTITGPALAQAVREVQISGLTGDIQLDENGNRPGYFGFICVVDPWDPVLGAQISSSAIIARYFDMEDEDAVDQMEYTSEVQWPLMTSMIPHYTAAVNPYTIANTTWLNKRKYNTSDGMFDKYQQISPIPPSTGPISLKIELEENTVAAYYCEQGCGGNTIDIYNISKYQNGDCVSMGQCLCHDGFFGDACENMICQCKNGRCDVPRICICDAGWTGTLCENAICSTPCQNGRCTSPDVCTCDSGYVGGDCSTVLIVIIVVPIIAVIIIVLGTVLFLRWFLKRQALKAALSNLDWRCSWDEEVQTGVGAVSMVSTAGEEIMTKKNYISWKSQRCFAQKYSCDTLDVNDEGLRLEVVHLKELRHNNLVVFVGACLEWPNVCILTEICPKGSLEDLLANDTVRLGWDFKYSLLKDICRGMDYLHRSALESHGRLKSTNCLVDNRWTCKIAGFGLPSIRHQHTRKDLPGKDEEEVNPLRALFWTSPELLVSTTNIDNVGKGTPAGDVYSFSIIMTEVISREEPYSNEIVNLTADEIIQLVRDRNAPSAAKAKRRWYESGGDTTKLMRPKIEDSNLPEEYNARTGLRKLCEQNWNETPENRLTFRQNLDRLNEIHPIKGELIDNLVNMLEKYSSNLEAIVAERTKELMVEKAKTEQLVSQMLPKKVVEDLKHGRTVEPESFECVTIFFSDLVGFTAIAKESTPLQVVDLLNDLYTTFDAILDNYDVYKVETIGDAYMVVSGLPIRNGDLHAGEIASVSLDLLSSMCDFKIRHMPGTILQLRIGMHSGPCVAGVVGLKMPRYCLFGDTVNTASRMESSSMALRIHMSEHTANILFKLGGYHLDCRGEREVKGKGVMTTYWLEGKDGFNKQLPGRELAVSASKHEFK